MATVMCDGAAVVSTRARNAVFIRCPPHASGSASALRAASAAASSASAARSRSVRLAEGSAMTAAVRIVARA